MRGRPVWQTERRRAPNPTGEDPDSESNRHIHRPLSHFERSVKASAISGSTRNNQDDDSDDDDLPGAYAVTRVDPEHRHSVEDLWDSTDHGHNTEGSEELDPLAEYEEFADEDRQPRSTDLENPIIAKEDPLEAIVSISKSEVETVQRRTVGLSNSQYFILFLLLVVVVCLIGGVAYALSPKQTVSDSSTESEDSDCDSVQDPFLQCQCNGRVSVTDTTVVDVYNALVGSHLAGSFLDDNVTINSCTPGNFALLWLAREMVRLQESGHLYLDRRIQDRLVIAILFETLGGRGWDNKENWMTDSPVCSWYGVQCNMESRITALALPNNKLQGTLDTRLGLLPEVTSLDLSRNEIVGTIPLHVWSLPSLELLLLNQNQLKGTLPNIVSGSSPLKKIDLSLNQLTGNFPSLASFESLVELELSDLFLTGSLPNDMHLLSHLASINITSNRGMEGLIPSTFSLIPNLHRIDASLTLISGSVTALQYIFPPSIEEIWLGTSLFHGSLSTSIGRLSNLRVLVLDEMPLEGTLPSELGSCSLLNTLSFTNTNMRGSLPSELANLSVLKELYVDQNEYFSGTVPSEFASMTNLEVLSIFRTAMSNSIPSSICANGGKTRVFLEFPPESCTCCETPPGSWRPTTRRESGDIT